MPNGINGICHDVFIVQLKPQGRIEDWLIAKGLQFRLQIHNSVLRIPKTSNMHVLKGPERRAEKEIVLKASSDSQE